jgi:predicted sulfurtransferase
MIAASLLKAHGFVHVINIEGGIKHILAQTPEVVDLMEQE